MEDRHEIIAKLKEIAAQLGTTSVPRHQFLRHSKVSERRIMKLFGSYNELVTAAGLRARQFPTADTPTFSDNELLDEIVRILRLPDSKPTRIFFEQNAKVSASVCERRFGGWISAVSAASKRLDSNQDVDLLRRIGEYTSPSLRSTVRPLRGGFNNEFESSEKPEANDHPGHEYLATSSSNIYGEFVNFRGLQHAPVNEQGVVFLFGMICREMGYVVEIVKTGFPDCEAKRKIRSKPGMWQRVRIEFEYQSRNFRSHGHDPDQCDVIVCWEHNWTECPLEVVELKTILRELSPSVD